MSIGLNFNSRARFEQPRRFVIARYLALLVFPGLSRPPHDLFQAGWLRPPGLPEVLVDFIAVAHLGAGIADQLPTDQAGVAAVHGVAEHAFDRVSAQELEESRLLYRSELGVLIRGRQAREIAESFYPCTIGL